VRELTHYPHAASSKILANDRRGFALLSYVFTNLVTGSFVLYWNIVLRTEKQAMYSSRLSVALTNNVARESPAPKNCATSVRWGLLEHCITMLKRLFVGQECGTPVVHRVARTPCWQQRSSKKIPHPMSDPHKTGHKLTAHKEKKLH